MYLMLPQMGAWCTIRVSPIELQIVYKLYLGSEKNVGDAVFLYTLFRDYIDRRELEKWCTVLRVDWTVRFLRRQASHDI